jgi:hypothetical protein
MDQWLGKSQQWLQKVAEYYGGGKCMKQTFESDAASVVGMKVAVLNLTTGHIWNFPDEGWQAVSKTTRLVSRLERKTAKDRKGSTYKAPVGVPRVLDKRGPQHRDAPFLTFLHRALDIAMAVCPVGEVERRGMGTADNPGVVTSKGMFVAAHVRWICEPMVEVLQESWRAGHTRHDILRVLQKLKAMQKSRSGARHREDCVREVETALMRWWKASEVERSATCRA